ncbi:MAG: MBL fold metallo-hydrolase [Candidatus Dependentiae bacterium]|nr:MBL fold metallo-hydrolase [Candidatus Dependentiae bacterium]
MKKLWIVCIAILLLAGTLMMFKKTMTDDVSAQCHYSIGQFKLIYLLDGTIDFPLDHIIKDSTNFDHPYFHKQPGESIQVPINVFLVDTGKQVILFDTGLAGMFHSKTGQLAKSMQQAGYKPEQITAICITHFHPDHISGLLHADGTKAFVHADLYVAKSEADYWLNSTEHGSIVSLLQKVFASYNVQKFTPDQQLFDGISVYASPGHTPGHVGFLCKSGNQIVLIWGDIIHMPAIQFAHPGISFTDDTDSAQAILTRKAILQQAIQQGWIIAGVHLASPGIGTITFAKDSTADQPAYQWVPISLTC